MNVKNPTSCLARWALQLQQYNFKILHRLDSSKGKAMPYPIEGILVHQ